MMHRSNRQQSLQAMPTGVAAVLRVAPAASAVSVVIITTLTSAGFGHV